MRRPTAAALLALLVVFAALSPALAAASAPDHSGPSATAPGAVPSPTTQPTALGGALAQTGDVAADTVVLRATLDADGDAEWRIAYRIELDDENTTAAFEGLQADIRENRSAYVARFESRIGTTVAAAENATGREMAAANFSVTAQRDPFPTSTDYGVVAYSFTWEGFAATQGNRVVAGDALAGLFLDSGTVLTVAWPDGYDARSVAPEADERSDTAVTWRGERNFGPDQPRVTVAPASALPVRPAYLAAAAVVLLGVAGAVVLRRRGTLPLGGDDDGALAADAGAVASSPAAAGADAETESGAAGDDDAATDAAASDPDAATTGGESEAGGAGAAGDDTDGTASGDPGDDDATPPEELLSPHERVIRLVEGNGGRMKQADVTEELGWSAARTSQVVGDLRDDGTIESFRLGRENVLRLPDADDEPHPGEPDRPGDDE